MQKYPTKMLALDFDFFAKIVYLSEKLEITLLNSSGYVILYPLSFAEDVKLRPGEDVTSSKRRCKCFLKSVQYQVRSFKLADLAGPGKSKKKVKRTKDPPKSHRRRKTQSLEMRNVQNHSFVPFNLEGVLENPEKNPKPTMVHP